jgi:hypothetical protein
MEKLHAFFEGSQPAGAIASLQGWHLPNGASVLHEHEGHLGKGQGGEGEIMLDVSPFGFLAAQEFPAGRQIEEQIAHLDAGSRGRAGGLDFEQFTSVDDDLRRLRSGGLRFARCQGETADAGDAGQGFTTETHGGNRGQVIGGLNFTGGVAFEAEQGIVAAHAQAVVGDPDQAAAPGLDFGGDGGSLGIERILDQFLDHAGGAFDDFAGGDLVGDLFGQKPDAIHAGSGRSGEHEGKNRATPGLSAGVNASLMVLDDAFADGETQPRALGLAVSGKRFEEARCHLGCDAGSGVLDLGGDFVIVYPEAQRDSAAVGHGIDGIVNQIEKHVSEPAWIEQEGDRRGRVLAAQSYRFLGDFGLNFRDNLLHQTSIIGKRQDICRLRAAGEFEQLIDHVAQAVHLPVDAPKGSLALLRRGGGGGGHFGGKTDDGQWILEIVNYGTGEASDYGQPLGLEHFLEILPVEIAHAEAKLADHADRQPGRTLHHLPQGGAGHEKGGDFGSGPHRRRTGFIVQNGHFAKKIARSQPGEHLHLLGGDGGGNLNRAFGNQIQTIARIAGAEDRRIGSVMPGFDRVGQSAQFFRR